MPVLLTAHCYVCNNYISTYECNSTTALGNLCELNKSVQIVAMTIYPE